MSESAIFLEQLGIPAAMLDRKHRYLAATGAWCDMFHINPASLAGSNHWDFFPDYRAEFEPRVREVMATGRTLTGEIPSAHPTSMSRCFRWELRPWRRGASGPYDGVILTFQDVTDVKSPEADAASEARFIGLNQMGAAIAHEINNPLAIINAGVDRIESHIRRGDGEGDGRAVHGELARIRKTVERISRVLRGLRSLIRWHPDEPYSLFSVSDLIEDAASFARWRRPGESVRLELPSAEELPPDTRISCIPGEIAQVLLNLLNNAMDAASGEAPWVRVNAHIETEWVMLRVRDSGPGVPEEFEGRVMEPFFTTKPSTHGSGLGLSICRSIVRRHGGALSYGRDSISHYFTAALPRVRPVSTPPPAG